MDMQRCEIEHFLEPSPPLFSICAFGTRLSNGKQYSSNRGQEITDWTVRSGQIHPKAGVVCNVRHLTHRLTPLPLFSTLPSHKRKNVAVCKQYSCKRAGHLSTDRTVRSGQLYPKAGVVLQRPHVSSELSPSSSILYDASSLET